MTGINYKKAYDKDSQIIGCLQMFRISEKVIKFITIDLVLSNKKRKNLSSGRFNSSRFAKKYLDLAGELKIS